MVPSSHIRTELAQLPHTFVLDFLTFVATREPLLACALTSPSGWLSCLVPAEHFS